MAARAPKGRNVKSAPGQGARGAADGHERAKDFLTAAEIAARIVMLEEGLIALLSGKDGAAEQARRVPAVDRPA